MNVKKTILLLVVVFSFILFTFTGCGGSRKDQEKISSTEAASVAENSDENNEIRVENQPNLETKEQKNESEPGFGTKEQKTETKTEESKNDKKIEIKSQKDTKKSKNKTGGKASPLNKVTNPHAHEHKYVENVVAMPTCAKKGRRVFTCSGCGNAYSEEINALGHSFNGWTPDQVSHRHTCSRCGLSENRNHVWNSDGECSVCGVMNPDDL